MEENKEVLLLLQKIEAENRRQTLIGKIRCGLSAVSALCFVVILAMVLTLVPQVNSILSQAGSIVSQGDEIVLQAAGVMEQMETVLGNLEDTTQQMAEVDLESMVTDVDTLVKTGQDSLEQTMKKLDAIDFETLNKAIENLSDVIEPLAKFFNMFPGR